MKARRRRDPDVWIIRSGYRTDAEWRAAIATARRYGRRIVTVDADGRKRRLRTEERT